MSGGNKSIGLIRRAMGPALALIVIGSFAGHAAVSYTHLTLPTILLV